MKPEHYAFLSLLFLSQTNETHSKQFDEGKRLVNDMIYFIQNQINPTKVVAYLCRPTVRKFHLEKSLHQKQIPTTFRTFKSKKQFINKFHAKEHLLHIIDMSCEDSYKFLLEANDNGELDFPHRWLILGNIIDIPADLDIFVSSRVYIMLQNDRSNYEIVSIYKIDKSRSYNKNHIFENGEIKQFKHLSDTRNRSDLNGIHMNISLVVIFNDTLLHLEDFKDKQKDALTKQNWVMVNHITDILNVTRHFRFHNTWGQINPNTSIFNGEIGDLQLHISEIGGTPAFFALNRMPIIDYIFAPTPTFGRFIFRAPPLSLVSNVFTLPFNLSVWYACLLLLALSFIILFIIMKWEWWSGGFKNKVLGMLRPNWSEVVQMEIGAVCQQGSEAEPRSGAGRIATFTLFLSFMFLYVSYSANIVALLQSTTDSLRTLEDLLKSRIKLGVEDTPYTAVYAMQTGDVQKAIYHDKIQPNNYYNALVGVTKMRDEFFAFHSEPNTIYQLVNKIFQESEKCGLIEIGYLSLSEPWVPIRKNSPYKELIKTGYLKLKESGLQYRNYVRYYAKKPLCQNQGANFISVSIYDCYYASMYFGIGIGISIIILVFEILVNKLKMRQSNRSVVIFEN